MRLENEAESENVEDRRRRHLPGRRGAGLGCVGLLVVLGISLATGIDPRRILGLVGEVQEMTTSAPQPQAGPPIDDDPETQFVRKVLKTTETAWGGIFAQSGRQYEEPTLVLFEEQVDSACGFTSAAVGPFYCPSDRKVYLDLSFFRELNRRFGAPGDFAQAYVVAHEIGHHVQNLLGVSDRVEALQRRARSEKQANAYSVRLELQADCFAGVWGRSQQQILDPGDIEEGLRAAAAIGDDVIQRRSQGHVAPETWTHGSSEMRMRWLKRGLETGDPAACDTFK
jgi:predicted metalloprotease